jgi:hypothetical protein
MQIQEQPKGVMLGLGIVVSSPGPLKEPATKTLSSEELPRMAGALWQKWTKSRYPFLPQGVLFVLGGGTSGWLPVDLHTLLEGPLPVSVCSP